MNEKHRCCRCNQIARWLYLPDTRNEYPYFCDTHVPRGCSCNASDEVDDSGRLLPCCEYQYSENGWEVDADEILDLQTRLNFGRVA